MERFLLSRPIEKQRINDNLTVWLDSKNIEVAKVEIDDSSGITFSSRKGVISEIEERMADFNNGSIFLNEKLTEKEGDNLLTYLIRPGHNWNCAKRDFITTIDLWLNPLLGV